MNSQFIHEELAKVIRKTSGLEQSRGYLGMSSIGRCAREQVTYFLRGRGFQNDRAHQTCKRGYLIEGEFKVMLAAAGVLKMANPDQLPALADSGGIVMLGFERELVADFDPRFRGHTDGETEDGELFEIKSMTQDKFERAKMNGRISRDHEAQVQTYMRFGEYERAHVLCISSETFDHHTFTVARNESKGADLEAKAKLILAAIDAQDPLMVPCECGHCANSTQPRTNHEEPVYQAQRD